MQIKPHAEREFGELFEKFLTDAGLNKRQIASIIKANIKSMSGLIDTNINNLREIRHINDTSIKRITSRLKDHYGYEVSEDGVIQPS